MSGVLPLRAKCNAQPGDLYAARFSNAVEDGGDFFHRTLRLPKTTRSPKQAAASK
jgi:hypothetical protein